MKNDYEKIINIYSYVAYNVVYDYDRKDDETAQIEHSMYAALCENKAVCQGYALSIYRLLLLAGIDCRILLGEANESHAWNLVEFNDKYYSLDATWDAQSENYSYFLVSRDDMSDHLQDENQAHEELFSNYNYATEKYENETKLVTWITDGYEYIPSLEA